VEVTTTGNPMAFIQTSHKVDDSSQIGQVRREASRLVGGLGFDDGLSGKVSIIATELATNLFRYATGGEILMQTYSIAGNTGIEILALDRGPGLGNIGRCLGDGYSTGGTAGNGLGAVQRLASEFDIYSTTPGGTVVLARVNRPVEVEQRFCWGAVNRAAPNEHVSGDIWRLAFNEAELTLMVADGLGHGPLAAEAASVAASAFEENPFTDSTAFFSRADRLMRGTRGAAVALAHFKPHQSLVQFTGVGNISAMIRSRDSDKGRGLVSHNGTVGVEMRKVQQFEYPAVPRAIVILHSDGLQTRWTFDNYPGLTDRHPAIIAAVLYRDFCRGRDDVTVCVVVHSSPGEMSNVYSS